MYIVKDISDLTLSNLKGGIVNSELPISDIVVETKKDERIYLFQKNPRICFLKDDKNKPIFFFVDFLEERTM